MQKIKLLIIAMLSVFAGVSAQADTYKYTEGDGAIDLEVSEESGDLYVTVNTVSANLATCEFEGYCTFDDDSGDMITCIDMEDGMSQIKIKNIDADTLEIVDFPHETYCGMNGYTLGRYVMKK